MADEIARYVSPVISFVRTATEDTELHGQRIAEGEQPPAPLPVGQPGRGGLRRPDELDVDRSPNPHIAFGVGPHVCMGINLARLEIRVLFEELIRRFPDMHVAPGFTPDLRRARPGARHRLPAGGVHARAGLTGPTPSGPDRPVSARSGRRARQRGIVRRWESAGTGSSPAARARSSAATWSRVASSSSPHRASRADDHTRWRAHTSSQ